MKHNYRVFGEEPIGIVIEMGLGACIGEWTPIAEQLARTHGVLLYETGNNKSEASTEARTPLNIANELYELLNTVSHSDKIILIAHSQGGLYAQQFCRLYPDMVKGLVLLDPLSATDSKFKDILPSEEYKKSGVDKSFIFKLMYKLAKLKLGFISKALIKKAPPICYYDFSSDEKNDILNCVKNPNHSMTAINEYNEAHNQCNITNLKASDGFPDIPLVLITHSSSLAIEESLKFGNNSKELATRVEELWQSIMKEYLSFSTKSIWIEAKNSTHYIHLTEPQLIINTVNNLQ